MHKAYVSSRTCGRCPIGAIPALHRAEMDISNTADVGNMQEKNATKPAQ